jgi:hypothetical protein
MLEPYEKQLLEKIVKETEANHKILRGIQIRNRWATTFGLIKWAVILVPLIAAYIYLQPYLDNIKIIFDKLPHQLNTIEGFDKKLEAAKEFFKMPPDSIAN